ncbi:YeaH/YhbH family protein [Thalassotalea psychrophila]|uniref:UPF0229 protein RGQ13_16540 n=1 Tax=Thalassotalea psychrophila TaxID=3065647 RepID=A0ABY9TSA2_9GAMM|nr:YeaH/YhbH family protein [Colwelliaceae bacterium SQ149]
MAVFIDKRLNAKNKSMANRQRFVRRYKSQIKHSLAESINRRKVTDHQSDEDVSISKKDLSEPTFKQGEGGIKQRIYPGNDQFSEGDKIPRPKTSQGTGTGESGASDSGVGEDDFIFSISADEYLNLLFDDLELPNLQFNQVDKLIDYKTVRAGYCNEGAIANIDIVKSLQGSIARRMVMTSDKRKQLKHCQQQLVLLEQKNEDQSAAKIQLTEKIAILKDKIAKVPFIDTFDLRYRNYDKQTIPSSKAVMFCLMDVSGSMVQATKDMAKRFYILLYLFLTRNYKTINVVYIIHHTQAKEVDEQNFFYSKETGGTIISSALKLLYQIIKKRYNSKDWNIYVAQASDGDNWQDDTPKCYQLLANKILPIIRFYSYIEINNNEPKSLWLEYQRLIDKYPHFTMRQITEVADIYPVFRDLFKKTANINAGWGQYGR